MAKHLMQDAKSRLHNPKDILVPSDGFISYQTHFRTTFGVEYVINDKTGSKNTKRSLVRISRGVAHAIVQKSYQGKKLKSIDARIAFGTKKCVEKGLKRLGDAKINTSVNEQSNLTNRSMNACQVRKSLAFARSIESRFSLAWWVTCVLKFSRVYRSLRVSLDVPGGRRLYQKPTPAIAAGLATCVWSTLDLLRFMIPEMRGEIIS